MNYNKLLSWICIHICGKEPEKLSEEKTPKIDKETCGRFIRPASRISEIHLELPNYYYYHSPYETKYPDKRFIGRKKLVERFQALIRKNKTNSGAYLITGYRGMGKSSFVKKGLAKLIGAHDNEWPISIAYLQSFIIIMIIWIIGSHFLEYLGKDYRTIFLLLIASISLCISLSLFGIGYRDEGYLFNLNKQRIKKKPPKMFHNYLTKQISRIQQTESFKNSYPIALFLISVLFSWLLTETLIKKQDLGYPLVNDDLLLNMLYLGKCSVILLFLYFLITNLVRMLAEGFDDCKKDKEGETKLIATIVRYINRFSKPVYEILDVSLGFDLVSERDVYLAIVIQLKSKVRAYRLKRGFSLFRLFIVYLLLCIGLETPLMKDIMTQTRNSRITLQIFPALYDPYYEMIVSKGQSLEEYSYMYINRLRRATHRSISFEHQMDITRKLQLLNVTENSLLNLSNTEQRTHNKGILFQIFMGYQQFNIRMGAIVSYYVQMLSRNRNPSTNGDVTAHYFKLLGFMIYFLSWNIYYYLFKRHRKILRKLKDLENRCYASFTSIRNGDSLNPSKINLPFLSGRVTSIQYPIASSKDIETELLEIIQLIHIQSMRGSLPRFVVVIDEVDKIEPHENKTLTTIEESRSYGNRHANAASIADVSRKRQQAVFSLLSNLKHFFTTADALFFFIAGQELFDASLADVADRSYFLGSVFHQGLNLESFYKDLSDKQNTNITSMVEVYLCNLLIPEWYAKKLEKKQACQLKRGKYNHEYEMFNLNSYNEYLKEYFFPFSVKNKELVSQCNCSLEKIHDLLKKLDENGLLKRSPRLDERSDTIDLSLFDPMNYNPNQEPTKHKEETTTKTAIINNQDLLDLIRETEVYSRYNRNKHILHKIITQLHSFITYLAYRSNGAPKKIAGLLDDNLSTFSSLNNDRSIFAGFSKDNLYLSIGFNLQYNVNLINYLVSPLLFSLNSSILGYGDKLLIGSSYIFDHILKFHKTGFSMSDLDLMPEFIDINRAPEMRSMISRIINILKENHVEEVHSGLYDITFNRKLVEEIQYLSKINDKEAAAFNFTLDESVRMKQYLYAKIDSLSTSKQSDLSALEHSIVPPSNSYPILCSQLGDLYYYDDEYIDAELQYMNSLHHLKQLPVDRMGFSNVIDFIKNLLKIGLTNEKMGNNDKALACYEEASIEVVKYRNIFLGEFRLREVYFVRTVSDDTDWKKVVESIHMQHHWKDQGVEDAARRELNGLIFNDKLHFIALINDRIDKSIAETTEARPVELDDELVASSNNFWHMLMHHEYSDVTEHHLARSSIFENLQLLFLPFIAKLQVVERAYLGGIVFSDLLRTIQEYQFVSKILRKKEEMYVPMEFHRKLGNILFFKNSKFLENWYSHDTPRDDRKIRDVNLQDFFSLVHIDTIFPNFPHRIPSPNIEKDKGNQTTGNVSCNCSSAVNNACDACFMYLYNLNMLLTSEIWDNSKGHVTDDTKIHNSTNNSTCDQITPIWLIHETQVKISSETVKQDNRLNPVMWDIIAVNLSCLSDTIIACSKGKPSTDIFERLFYIIFGQDSKEESSHNTENGLCEEFKPSSETKMNISKEDFFAIEESSVFCYAIRGYYLASIIYEKTGNYRGRGFNFKKVLYAIQWSLNDIKDNDKIVKIDRLIKDYLIPQSIECIALSQSSISRMEIQKIKRRLMADAIYNTDMIDLRSTTLNAEVQEYILSYEHWLLMLLLHKFKDVNGKTDKSKMQKIIDEYRYIIRSWFIGDHENSTIFLIHNQVLKMINYSLLDQIIYEIVTLMTDKDLQEMLQDTLKLDNLSRDQIQVKAILDGLFCINQAIKFVNINGITYKTNHFFVANLYKYMYKWCDYLRRNMIARQNTICGDSNEDVRDYLLMVQDSIREQLIAIFGGECEHLLSPQYYLSKAQEHFVKAIDTHQGGDYYRQIISNMHCLHEDFGSDMYHFFAALDRILLNKAVSIGWEKEIKNKMKISTIYQTKYFTNIPS